MLFSSLILIQCNVVMSQYFFFYYAYRVWHQKDLGSNPSYYHFTLCDMAKHLTSFSLFIYKIGIIISI